MQSFLSIQSFYASCLLMWPGMLRVPFLLWILYSNLVRLPFSLAGQCQTSRSLDGSSHVASCVWVAEALGLLWLLAANTPSISALGLQALVPSNPFPLFHLESKYEVKASVHLWSLFWLVCISIGEEGTGRSFPPGSNKYFLATYGIQIHMYSYTSIELTSPHTHIACPHTLLPWIWQHSCISFSIMVTLFIWMKHKLVSSKRPAR